MRKEAESNLGITWCHVSWVWSGVWRQSCGSIRLHCQSTNQLNRHGFATVSQCRNVHQAKPPQLNDLCHHLGPVCPTWDLKDSSRKREFCTTTTRLVFSFFPVSMRPRLKRRPALVVQLKRVKWLVCRTAQPPWTPSCLDFPVPRDPENALLHPFASWKHTHLQIANIQTTTRWNIIPHFYFCNNEASY